MDHYSDHYSKEDILRLVEEEDVEFIRLQFTDVFGVFKNVAITASQLPRVLENGGKFDGSAIQGFASVDASDLFLVPDLDTFAIFPWRPQQGKVARFICSVCREDGSQFEGDPRYILKQQIQKAKDKGYTLNVGPEMEFFLFHLDDKGLPTTVTNEQAGYFDMGPLDLGENARRDIVLTLEDMGYEVEASHHEHGAGQHEIDLRYDEALRTADSIMTFKLAVRTIAKRHGLFASFMPKPQTGVSGSGMHLNLSLHKNGRNIFTDPSDPLKLSREAYYFMGGLFCHMKGITILTNPLVNSYKRFEEGFEAPVYMTWSAENRNQMIRIPATIGNDMRLELRSPDPSCNPYLALAAVLAAGMEGMEKKILPPERSIGNPFLMTAEERKERGIHHLPMDLHHAVKAFRNDSLIQQTVGEHISQVYFEEKEKEWSCYRSQVSEWEKETYLYCV